MSKDELIRAIKRYAPKLLLESSETLANVVEYASLNASESDYCGRLYDCDKYIVIIQSVAEQIGWTPYIPGVSKYGKKYDYEWRLAVKRKGFWAHSDGYDGYYHNYFNIAYVKLSDSHRAAEALAIILEAKGDAK